jgi:hypothetical protein
MSVHPIHNKTNIDPNSMHVVAFGYKKHELEYDRTEKCRGIRDDFVQPDG